MGADDIKKHQFTSANQPKKRRSRKGIPNRATVYKNLLDLIVSAPDPAGRGYIKLTLYEAMALGQIRAAIRGNTRAFIEIQDSLFGKQERGLEGNVNITPEQIEALSDEQLEKLIKKSKRIMRRDNVIPQITIIEARQQFEARREKVRQEIAALDDDGP